MRISDWSSDVCSSDLRGGSAAASYAHHRAFRARSHIEPGHAEADAAEKRAIRHGGGDGHNPLATRQPVIDAGVGPAVRAGDRHGDRVVADRKSTRLNSSH